MKLDKQRFYQLSKGLFSGRYRQDQVDGIEGILKACDLHGDQSPKFLAYALATAYHETGRVMSPVREGFASTDAGARKVVARRKYGKPMPPYGHVYYGRGQVQKTWLKNYRNCSADAGVDLVRYPDKMLEPTISARILICGLLDGRWNGHGKGVMYYLDQGDLKGARRTVNITDKWQEISGYYERFLEAIESSILPEPAIVPIAKGFYGKFLIWLAHIKFALGI